MKRRLGEKFAPAGFLFPNFVGFLVFTAGPVVYSLFASFTNQSITRPGGTEIVWFQNYGEILHDPKFWLSFNNTIYLMLGMPVSIALSLWIAVLLNRKMRMNSTFKALLFLPSVTSGVAIMILWHELYNPEFGPVNQMINGLGTWCNSAGDWFAHFHSPFVGWLGSIGHWFGSWLHGPDWLLSTKNLVALDYDKVGLQLGHAATRTHPAVPSEFGLGARDALNFMGIWGAIGGGNMLLYLAGLTNVPEELLEAAQVDGAGKWACFWGITWPQLAPTTFFIVVMSIIGGLQGGFETARVMTQGGPAATTTTMAYYIFNKAFQEYRIGYAAAVSWILFAIVLIFTILNWRRGNRDASLV